ncbi:hypothetical protein GCM10022243_11750 [Saccharothrix violaceirubra]
MLSQATEGSDQADVDQANAQFAEVANGVDDLQKFLANGISQAENISARL